MGAERPIPGTHACAGSGASEAKPNEWSGRARASDEVHPSQLISLLGVFADIFVACNEVHHYQLMRLLCHKIVFCSRILVDHKTPVLKLRPGPRDKLG